MISVRPLTGDALNEALPDVARLRIEVFRAFPYLYDGTPEYERQYLRSYKDNPNAILIGAFDGSTLVGASTGLPLRDHEDDFAQAFAQTDLNQDDIFYCAESVLLPQFRKQGIGHQFFDYREDHARDLGFTYCAFSSVVRPADHPARPEGYRALDGFWMGRGYAPRDDIVAHFKWKDLGDEEETSKPLKFWIHTL